MKIQHICDNPVITTKIEDWEKKHALNIVENRMLT